MILVLAIEGADVIRRIGTGAGALGGAKSLPFTTGEEDLDAVGTLEHWATDYRKAAARQGERSRDGLLKTGDEIRKWIDQDGHAAQWLEAPLRQIEIRASQNPGKLSRLTSENCTRFRGIDCEMPTIDLNKKSLLN